MMNFANVSSLIRVRCTFALYPDKIILEFLSSWLISPMFLYSPNRMYFSFSCRWHQFRISVIMMNFTNVSALANMRCRFSLYENQIIGMFLLAGWISSIFNHWPTSDLVFLLIQMISFYNFSEDDEFRRFFIIDQNLMFLFFWSWWHRCRICLIMMNFTNVSSLTNSRSTFFSSCSWGHFWCCAIVGVMENCDYSLWWVSF